MASAIIGRVSVPPHPALPAGHPLRRAGTEESLLLRNYRGQRTVQRPIWFMRQAGRSLPEYRRLRAGSTMLEACLAPELAAEITLQPVHRHRVDAAIYYSDIMVPVLLAGVEVDIVPGTGPVIAHPIRSPADVAALPELDPAALAPISAGVTLACDELGGTPLIGFAGGPFTVASYLVEGRSSRTWRHTRALINDDPDSWHRLAGWVARIGVAFLRAQVLAGASAIQLFDSWIGALPAAEYTASIQPHSAWLLGQLAELGIPRVHFGARTGHLLPELASVGADVLGIGTDIDLIRARKVLGPDVPLQGNIDPELLTAQWPVLSAHVYQVVSAGRGSSGHVVNLGHGVPKDTDPDVLTRIVELVHSLGDDDADEGER